MEFVRDIVGRPRRWGCNRVVGKYERFEARELGRRMRCLSTAFFATTDAPVSLEGVGRDKMSVLGFRSVVREQANTLGSVTRASKVFWCSEGIACQH